MWKVKANIKELLTRKNCIISKKTCLPHSFLLQCRCMSGLKVSRRSFLKTLGAAAITAPFITRNLIANPPSERVRYGAIGSANMARADIDQIISHPKIDFVCVADVDSGYRASIKKDKAGVAPNLKVYADFREMLEKHGRDLDCISVTTPDHGHAIQAMSAMQLGINVYCQKPLAHDLYEVRCLQEFATDHNLVTQMGIQIHSNRVYRTTVKMIQSGIIGKIKETHSWCGNRHWGSTDPRPTGSDPIPESLNWDLWLNTAADRPFVKDIYHPNNWRKVQDFGTGIFGDMGCHIFDPVFKALELTSPTEIRSVGPRPNDYFWGLKTEMHYLFPGTQYTEGDTIRVYWYDGPGERPPKEIMELVPNMPTLGSIFIGTKGVLVIPHIGEPVVYLGEPGNYKELDDDDELQKYSLPDLNHWHQFVDAVRGEGKTTAGFNYAGPLTEAVLLGSVACKFEGQLLKWNSKRLKFDNKAANALVKRKYRKGWKVKGL